MDTLEPPYATASDGDQRSEPRAAVCWHGEMLAGRETAACTVLDISPFGARLMTAVLVAIELPVTLNLGARGVYYGEVRWHDGGLVGVKFTAARRAEHSIGASAPVRAGAVAELGADLGAKVHEWRAEPRREVTRRARLSSGSRSGDCQVLEISPSGARVLAGRHLAPDSAATLTLGPRHSLHGRVVWAIGEICGLRFDSTQDDDARPT